MLISPRHTFGIRLFGCSVQVGSSSAEALAAVEPWVFPALPRLADFAEEPEILAQVEPSGDRVRLSVHGKEVAAVATPLNPVLDLIRRLDEAVIPRVKGVCAVHAGCVLWQGRVLLLPGGSHAGKSSLVAELLRRGPSCFSDEYALVDVEGLVHPYPRPLLLRNGGEEQVPVLPQDFGVSAATAPAPLGWVLALEYRAGARLDVAPIQQSEAAMVLLRNTPHIWAENPQLPALFTRAAAGARCWAGVRGEAGEAADQILALIGA